MFDNLNLRDLSDVNAGYRQMLEAAHQERMARLAARRTARPWIGDRLLLFLADAMIDLGLNLRVAVHRKRTNLAVGSGYAD
jgi:hypothetical protein